MEKKSFCLRMEARLLYKLKYIARHENRSAAQQARFAVRRMVRKFEAEHGEIPAEQAQ